MVCFERHSCCVCLTKLMSRERVSSKVERVRGCLAQGVCHVSAHRECAKWRVRPQHSVRQHLHVARDRTRLVRRRAGDVARKRFFCFVFCLFVCFRYVFMFCFVLTIVVNCVACPNYNSVRATSRSRLACNVSLCNNAAS